MCIALLLLIRDLSIKLGAVLLAGDFNKAVERETPSSDERRTSPLEAAFRDANVPWPTLDVTPLWGPGGEPNGQKWPDCCGFMVLSESQNQGLFTPWLHQCCLGGHRAESHRPHLALRAVAPSQVRGAQAQARFIPCGLKVAAERSVLHTNK